MATTTPTPWEEQRATVRKRVLRGVAYYHEPLMDTYCASYLDAERLNRRMRRKERVQRTLQYLVALIREKDGAQN